MIPYFTLSKSVILRQYNTVASISNVVSYSSKTNPIITPILEEETNCMFSIHLVNELQHVKDKSRVLYLAQAWNEKVISDLIKQGVKWFVVDNEIDLDVLLTYLQHCSIKVNVLLRLKLKERTIRTEKFYVFGMPSDVIKRRINELKKHPRIEKCGIHFHRKTQNMAEWNFEYDVINVLGDSLNQIDILNVGGGLPSEYANTNAKVITAIINKISEFKNYLNTINVQLMIEPGRFIAAPAGMLHTNIIAIHDNTIIVNASVYNSDMDALIVPVKLRVEQEVSKESGKPYIIKGMTPCSLDLFRYRVYLNNPTKGDNITFINAGAYNFTTEFCDLSKLETRMIK